MRGLRALRACPVCPKCGSKKFKTITNQGKTTIVECLKCTKRINI